MSEKEIYASPTSGSTLISKVTGTSLHDNKFGLDNIVASNLLYSDYQASLANGSSIDSGYLDMGNIDKVQFSGYASASGMTMTIYSRANDSQTPLITPVTYTDGTFYMFNIICRQRYMRFVWENGTGSTVTNVSMEIKASHGSSDKLSVFPIGVQPSIFSQAALVQAVLRGKEADGSFIEVGVNQVGALNVSDFLLDVAREKYDDYRIDTKFGKNLGINTGSAPEDCWNGGGDYTGFNATANENLRVASSSTQDAGTVVSSGTATGGSSTTLEDTGATFISDGVAVGDLIINDTQSIHGVISEVTSETILTVHRYRDGEIEVYSVSSGDSYRVVTTNGTGAAVIKASKILDEDYQNLGSVYIVLNGTTNVDTTVNCIRCARQKVVLVGSNGVNVGDITLRQATTTANIFSVIPANSGQSVVACDTVPAGKSYIISNLYATIVRASGAAGSAEMQFQVRPIGESWQTKRSPSVSTGIPYSPTINPDIIISEKSDIRWRIESVSNNNTICSSEFEYIEISNTVI